MYTVRLYEDGAFVTQVGGPVRTIAEVELQVTRACKYGLAPERLQDVVGFKIKTIGGRVLFAIAMDEWLNPVTIEKEEEGQ